MMGKKEKKKRNCQTASQKIGWYQNWADLIL
jgi:hypothetical protein